MPITPYSILLGCEYQNEHIKDAVETTHKNAYAHHIQRLMITGNYALLTGIAPKAINEWYWIVYVDAYHWVELPNVIGMATFSDGGVLQVNHMRQAAHILIRCQTTANHATTTSNLSTVKSVPFQLFILVIYSKEPSPSGGNPRMKFVFNQLKKLKNLPEILESAETFIKTNHLNENIN